MTTGDRNRPRLWRHGAWLGASYALVEVGLSGLGDPIAWDLAGVEIILNVLGWSLFAAGLAAAARLLGARLAPKTHAAVLLAAFFVAGANMLIHPFLLAGVHILSRSGARYSVIFAAAVIAPAIPLVLPLRRRRGGDAAVHPMSWLLSALIMGGVFALGREQLGAWPAGSPRVVAALALAATGLIAAVCSLEADRLFRRRRLTGAALVVLALGFTLPYVARAGSADPIAANAETHATPVILVSLDTTRQDHLSYFGYSRPTSPQLDSFLASTRVFPRAYATSSWTLPSHASVFTGLYPIDHGAHWTPGARAGALPNGLDPRVETLAEWFRGRGYATAAFSSNRLAVSPELGLNRGFQSTHVEMRHDDRPIPLNALKCAGRLFPVRWLARFGRTHWDAATITDRALDWITRHADLPFFVFVNFMEPHSSYVPSSPLTSGERVLSPSQRLRWNWEMLDERGADVLDSYDGEIRDMDEQIGRLVAGLRATGVLERAIVVIFSDHGEAFGEVGLWSHGKDVHESLLRALIAIRSPRGRFAGNDPTLVNLADIPELIRDALEERPPGRSLRRDGPWIAGEKNRTHRDTRRGDRWGKVTRLVAVRWGEFKLIEGMEKAMLFDLVSDPGEETDVAAAYPETTRVLRDFARDWDARHRGQQRSQGAEDPRALRESLRGLGYID